MTPLAIFWTVTALIGLILTGRNLRLAFLRWRILERRHVREALLITAFTAVRSHSIVMYVHATFLLLGIRAMFPGLFDELEVNVVLGAFLLVPLLLIVASLTIHDDGERALHLERE